MQKKKVLIVEDNKSFRELLQEHIESLGYNCEVSSVADLNGFILDFNKKKPDLIFLDVVLPGVSGLEIFKFLKSLDCKAKIYVMSGFLDNNKEMVGAEFFLEKPLDFERLEDILLEIFDN